MIVDVERLNYRSDSESRDAAAEIERLRARLAEAEKVIKPFADLSAVFSKQDADELWCFMRLLHLRAAAQWMKENKPCASGK